MILIFITISIIEPFKGNVYYFKTLDITQLLTLSFIDVS